MKGFVVFNNRSGMLVYSRMYTQGKLSKVPDHHNPLFDNADPMQIASHFFALLKLTQIMVEEYKAEVGELAVENDVNTKMSIKSGFRSMKSEYIDYFIDNHEQYPLSIVLFYDADQLNEGIMRSLTAKVLDVLVYRFENKFEKGNFNVQGGPKVT
jgi:hypothetical protein